MVVVPAAALAAVVLPAASHLSQALLVEEVGEGHMLQHLMAVAAVVAVLHLVVAGAALHHHPMAALLLLLLLLLPALCLLAP